MAHLSDGLFLRPQLGSFSASVFQCTIIILLLTDSCGGLPQGVVVAPVGDDVILPCHLEPAENAVSKTLEWGRLDLEPRFVHVWYEGRDYLVNQNPSYKGRTSVSVQRLQQGDLSLQLSALKPSDSGIYRCYYVSQDKHSTVELIVGSVSSPVITDIYLNSREVELRCESQGWHPEPEVLWLDGEGNPVSAGPTEKVLGPDGLYAVSSRATVEKRRSSSFTCRVQQKAINQTREAFIQVSADCLEGHVLLHSAESSISPSSLNYIIIGSVCGTALILAGGLFYIWKSQKSSVKYMVQLLNNNKDIQEELSFWTEYEKQVLKQKGEKLRLQVEELEKEMEGVKKKIKSVEGELESVDENETGKRSQVLREKENLLSVKHKLESRKEILEKEERNTLNLQRQVEAQQMKTPRKTRIEII